MQFGKKLNQDTHTIFQKSSGNNRTFGKKLQDMKREPMRNEQYKTALFPENLKNLPQRSQLER